MLSPNYPAGVAVLSRSASREADASVGVFLPRAERTVRRDQVIGKPERLPRAYAEGVRPGGGISIFSPAALAWQHRTTSKYTQQMTRLAAANGGSTGPHPARDPV